MAPTSSNGKIESPDSARTEISGVISGRIAKKRKTDGGKPSRNCTKAEGGEHRMRCPYYRSFQIALKHSLDEKSTVLSPTTLQYLGALTSTPNLSELEFPSQTKKLLSAFTER